MTRKQSIIWLSTSSTLTTVCSYKTIQNKSPNFLVHNEMHYFLETMTTGMIPKPTLVMWMLMSMMIIVTVALLLLVMFLMMMIYIYITNQKNTKTAFFNHFSFILTPKNIHIYVRTYIHTYFKHREHTSYIVAPWIIINPKSPFSFSFISSPLTNAEAFTGLSFQYV